MTGMRPERERTAGPRWLRPAFRRAGAALWVVLCAGLLAACGAEIGDSCSSSVDCGSGRVCDLTQPGGYCTIAGCRHGDCPSDESVCVRFDDGASWCVKPCGQDDDCREGYACAPAVGRGYAAPSSFCNAVASPGRVPLVTPQK